MIFNSIINNLVSQESNIVSYEKLIRLLIILKERHIKINFNYIENILINENSTDTVKVIAIRYLSIFLTYKNIELIENIYKKESLEVQSEIILLLASLSPTSYVFTKYLYGIISDTKQLSIDRLAFLYAISNKLISKNHFYVGGFKENEETRNTRIEISQNIINILVKNECRMSYSDGYYKGTDSIKLSQHKKSSSTTIYFPYIYSNILSDHYYNAINLILHKYFDKKNTSTINNLLKFLYIQNDSTNFYNSRYINNIKAIFSSNSYIITKNGTTLDASNSDGSFILKPNFQSENPLVVWRDKIGIIHNDIAKRININSEVIFSSRFVVPVYFSIEYF